MIPVLENGSRSMCLACIINQKCFVDSFVTNIAGKVYSSVMKSRIISACNNKLCPMYWYMYILVNNYYMTSIQVHVYCIGISI